MNGDAYLTLAAPAEGFYREKSSKFIAKAFPVADETDIQATLAALKKEYADARHHCYAWVLGDVSRANDAGEPNHSAGTPILGQIRANNLHYVLVVVIRYFGGVKLGVGGLVHAYKTAAAEALTSATLVEKFLTVPLTIGFPYEAMNAVMRIVKDRELMVQAQNFATACEITLAVRRRDWQLVFESLQKVGGRPVTEVHE